MASEKPADLDFHCYQNRVYQGSQLGNDLSINTSDAVGYLSGIKDNVLLS